MSARPCKVCGEYRHQARGMCPRCYRRWWIEQPGSRALKRKFDDDWKKRNPEKAAETSRKATRTYRSDPEKAERAREVALRWKRENHDRVIAYSREYRRRKGQGG